MEMQMVKTLRIWGLPPIKISSNCNSFTEIRSRSKDFHYSTNIIVSHAKERNAGCQNGYLLRNGSYYGAKKLLGCLNVRGERPERKTTHVLVCLSHESSNIKTPICYNFLSKNDPQGALPYYKYNYTLGICIWQKKKRITFFVSNQSQFRLGITKCPHFAIFL